MDVKGTLCAYEQQLKRTKQQLKKQLGVKSTAAVDPSSSPSISTYTSKRNCGSDDFISGREARSSIERYDCDIRKIK